MKKTLITLAALAMASVAQAASVTPALELSGDSLVAGTISGISTSYTMSITVDWAKALGGGSDGFGDWQNTTMVRTGDLQVGGDYDGQTWWKNGVALFTGGEGELKAGIRFDNENVRGLTILTDTDPDDGVTVGAASISDNTYDFILTSDYVRDGKLTLFYSFTAPGDGKVYQTMYAVKNDETLTGVQYVSDNSNSPAAIDNLLIDSMKGAVEGVSLYNGVLTPAQIKAVAVPEPATATLSLLALAGLAARRRRK